LGVENKKRGTERGIGRAMQCYSEKSPFTRTPAMPQAGIPGTRESLEERGDEKENGIGGELTRGSNLTSGKKRTNPHASR